VAASSSGWRWRPKLILADEPTANLDSKNGEALMEMMRRLNDEEGITFIFTSHEQMVIDKAKLHITLKDGAVTTHNHHG